MSRTFPARNGNSDYCGKNVLITGGLGFIGANLARRLVECRARVTLVDSLIPEYGGNLFNIAGIEDKVRVNISDVRDHHSMKYLMPGAGLALPAVRPHAVHVFHQYAVCLQQRDELRAHLRKAGVGTLVHYPVPVHLQPAYRGRLPALVPLPQTERVSRQVLSLPIYPQLRDDQCQRVCEEILHFLEAGKSTGQGRNPA